MFCDLVGSTDLSQHLDAEDLRSVVRAYQEAASGAIDRYAGHIAQYLGDGLLVYFGYPQAHEDDAERAVRAGLEILAALRTLNDALEPKHGMRLAARVGIHTGPVVIGAMGGGAKSEVLALGDTTNIAARLEAVAAADTVVISGATQRLVPGMFLLQDLGTPPLKGVATPIHAHAVLQATGVRSRLDVDPSLLTPLVGREQELGLLIARWEQAQEGDGQAVLIAGEAGVGKSRLLQAFRERLAAAPHSWLECRCTPYSQGSAFHPLIELVEQGLGFKPHDDPEIKLRRLEAGLAYAKLSTSEVVPLIAALLSLPLPDRYPPLRQSPELQRKQTMEALVAWTLALAEQQPLVMLYEDLHWCDPSTVEILGLLLGQSPTAKVLTLLTFRPSFAPPWPGRSHVTPPRERHQRELGLQMALGVPLAAARGWSHPEYEGTYARARELASQIGESPELPRVLAGMAAAYYGKGDLATGAEVAQQALAAAERTGDVFDLLAAHFQVGNPLLLQGHFSRALQHFEHSIKSYDPSSEHGSLAYTGGAHIGVFAHQLAAVCHLYLGHPDRALAEIEEALALAKRVEHPISLATALLQAGVVHGQRGEFDRRRERAEEVVVLAERLGFPLYLGLGRFSRGFARVESGEGKAGIAEMEQALGELAGIGSGIGAPSLLFFLAEGLRKVGSHDDALGALAPGIARAEQQGQHYYDAELHRLRAEILLDMDGNAVEEAEALFHQSLEIARRQEAKTFELRAATSLARLWQRQGKRDAAQALLAPLYAWFTEGFDTLDLKDAKTLLEELS